MSKKIMPFTFFPFWKKPKIAPEPPPPQQQGFRRPDWVAPEPPPQQQGFRRPDWVDPDSIKKKIRFAQGSRKHPQKVQKFSQKQGGGKNIQIHIKPSEIDGLHQTYDYNQDHEDISMIGKIINTILPNIVNIVSESDGKYYQFDEMTTSGRQVITSIREYFHNPIVDGIIATVRKLPTKDGRKKQTKKDLKQHLNTMIQTFDGLIRRFEQARSSLTQTTNLKTSTNKSIPNQQLFHRVVKRFYKDAVRIVSESDGIRYVFDQDTESGKAVERAMFEYIRHHGTQANQNMDIDNIIAIIRMLPISTNNPQTRLRTYLSTIVNRVISEVHVPGKRGYKYVLKEPPIDPYDDESLQKLVPQIKQKIIQIIDPNTTSSITELLALIRRLPVQKRT